MAILGLLWASIAGLCGLVQADEPAFATQVIKLAVNPLDLVTTDINADGQLEVIVGGLCCGAQIEVLQLEESGEFQSVQTLGSASNWSITAGDLNGDGRDEVVSTGGSSGPVPGEVNVYEPDNGTLWFCTSIPMPWEGRDIQMVDVEADGDLDVVTACLYGDALVVSLNKGKGNLGAGRQFSAADGAWDLASADFNGDGLPDFAVTGIDDTAVHILLAASGGGFLPALVFPPTPTLSEVEAGDLDEDGVADIVTGNDGYSIHLGVGDGTFVPGLAKSSKYSNHVLISDVDDDGHLDVCQTNKVLGQVDVHLGNGTGSLPDTVPVPAGENVDGVLAADVDLDGHADFITFDVFSGALGVIPGVGCGAPKGGYQVPGAYNINSIDAVDFSQDGLPDLVVGDENVVRVLAGDGEGAFGEVAGCAVGTGWILDIESGDLNGDGVLDLAVLGNGGDVILVPGTGTGSLGDYGALANDIVSFDAAIGDVTADGILDVLATDTYSQRVIVWRGLPGGGFMPPQLFPVSPNQSRLVLSDFNEDGLLDAVAMDSGFTLLPGESGATFGAGVPWFVETTMENGVGADIDGDGHTDLVSQDGDTLVYVTGGGDGTFSALGFVDVPWHYPVVRAAGDLVGDGAAECLVQTAAGAVIYQHDGATLKAVGMSLIAGNTSTAMEADSAMVLADVDQDADLDIVTGSDVTPYGITDDHSLAIFPHLGPWLEMGMGLAGAAGTPPLLGAGLPGPGGQVTFHVCKLTARAPAILVAGSTSIVMPFKGGVLVPAPDVIVGPFVATAAGTLNVSSPWPAGVPAGLSLYLQAWIADFSGPAGWVASEALVTTTQ